VCNVLHCKCLKIPLQLIRRTRIGSNNSSCKNFHGLALCVHTCKRKEWMFIISSKYLPAITGNKLQLTLTLFLWKHTVLPLRIQRRKWNRSNNKFLQSLLKRLYAGEYVISYSTLVTNHRPTFLANQLTN